MTAICCVCAARPVIAKNRCRACYQYRWTHGHDRSVAMTERQRQRDEERRCSDRASAVVGSSRRAVGADRADVNDTPAPTAAHGDEHDRR